MPAERIDFDGFSVRVDLDRWPAKIIRALLRRHYERNERHLLEALLRPGDTMLELGSAIGVVALAAARIVAPGHVFCFDANPHMVEEARANFALNAAPVSVSNRVLVAAPDAAAPSTADFYATPYFLSSSLIRHRDDMVRVTVPCAGLEETLAACAANVMMVDIEGGEFELLSAARLDRVERLSVEIHLAHGSVAGCIGLIACLAAQGLVLDASRTSENVFVFTREAAPATGFAQAYLEGLEADRGGDTHRAAARMGEAARLARDNASAHMQCADLALRLGDIDAAIAASRAALEADGAHADALEQRGDLEARAGRDDAAAAAFEGAIALQPTRPLFHAGLATLRARHGAAGDAIAQLRRAAALVPERARQFAMLAALATRQDKFDHDAVRAPAAIPDATGRRRVLVRLAALVGDRFKLRQAAGALAAAIALAPHDEALHVALAQLTATPRDLRDAFEG